MIATLFVSLALAATDAPATSPAPTAPPAAAAPAPAAMPDDGDKMVCKSDAPTGTRFKTRRCLTKRQWAQIEFNARDSANALEMKSLHTH